MIKFWILLASVLFSLSKTSGEQQCFHRVCRECPDPLGRFEEEPEICANSKQISGALYEVNPRNFKQTNSTEKKYGCVNFKAHKTITDEGGDSTDYIKGCVLQENLNEICQDLEKAALKNGKVMDFCHICKEDLCNNAIKMQASLLILLSTVMIKLF